MSYQSLPPPPTGERWTDWGTRLNQYLGRIRSQLQHKLGNESADTDGVLLYDPEIDHVVVSRNGVFEPLSYGHNCYAAFYTLVTHSAAATNTAYAITWENTALSENIAVAASPNTSRIVFTHGGVYQIDFSAELLSSNSSSKSIYIWPRVNGSDIPYSTIVTSIASNGDRLITSRSGIFQVNAGDYLEAMFAVTDTALTIDGSVATAFAPESPSATLTVTELR
jgi:hypothetical protein